MICYKDRTWCPMRINLRCKRAQGCYRAFTSEDQKAAEEWWGGKDFPISQYSVEPECFIPIVMSDPKQESDGEERPPRVH